MSISIIFVSLLICFMNTNALFASSDQLIFTIDLVRHGDRTPVADIPKSPHHWKEGLENLTHKGVEQQFSLGQQLRKEYLENYKLLPDHYQAERIYVRSTDIPRTIASAKALLSGLYPGASIPINTVKRDDDDLLLVRPSRNPFSMIKLYFFKRSSWNEVEQKLLPIRSQIEEATGLPLKTADDLNTLADVLYIRQLYNVPFPQGISREIASQIISLDEKFGLDLFQREEVSEPMGSHFLDTVKHYFEKAKNNKTQLKYALFLGHDSSLMAVMKMLGQAPKEWPPYATRLNFSLFRNGNDYHVRVNYNGKDLVMGRCGVLICPLSQFLSL